MSIASRNGAIAGPRGYRIIRSASIFTLCSALFLILPAGRCPAQEEKYFGPFPTDGTDEHAMNWIAVDPLRFGIGTWWTAEPTLELSYYHIFSSSIVVGGGFSLSLLYPDHGYGPHLSGRYYFAGVGRMSVYAELNGSFITRRAFNENIGVIAAIAGLQWFDGAHLTANLGLGGSQSKVDNPSYTIIYPEIQCEVGYAW
jgi:hypothetical protein